MRWPVLLVLAWLAVGPSACSTEITWDYDRHADFSGFRTYRWAPREGAAVAGSLSAPSLLESRIRTAVEHELAIKGYARTESVDADFVVGSHAARRATYDPAFAAPGWTAGLPTELDQYEERTLVLDIIDPNGMRLIWRGAVTTELDESAGPREHEAAIRKAVESILEGFPPRSK